LIGELRHIALCLLLFITNEGLAQSWQDGVNFQGALEQSGSNLGGQSVDLRFTISNQLAVVLWQETNTVMTNSVGVFSAVVGAGVSTGVGTASGFSTIDLASELTYFQVEIDTDGSGYLLFQSGQLLSVPFAMHSLSNADSMSLNEDLLDVNTAGLSSQYALLWNGSGWDVGNKNQLTVNYAATSNVATYVDTANYTVVNLVDLSDTSFYAFYMDTVNYATNTAYANTVLNTSFSDTSSFAINANVFHLGGDSLGVGSFMGSTNGFPMALRTNNIDRLEISENGNLYQGVTDSIPSIYLYGTNGFRNTGTLGSGTFTNITVGNNLYYTPKYNSMWMGSTQDTLWHEMNVDENNLIFGRNCWIRGHESAAFGDSCMVVPIPTSTLGRGEGSLAVGRRCRASGSWSLAVGYETYALTQRSFALGYQCSAPHGYACVAMGYKAVADGDLSPCVAIGQNILNNGKYSFAIGTNIDMNYRRGCFLYSDRSSTDTLVAPAPIGAGSFYDNKFIVRSAGGVVFYADPSLISGVQLFSGSGSWSAVSDYRKKENFTSIEDYVILKKLSLLKISEWSYIAQNDMVLHIGPMAQDFHTLYHYGEEEISISTIDMDGVIIQGIKDMSEKLEDIQTHVVDCELDSELDFSDTHERLVRLEELLKELEIKKK